MEPNSPQPERAGDVGSTRLLAAVIRMQCEIETLKESAAMFNEPYLSETSRAIDACNNPILGPLIQAGWHLQAAQCAIEANAKVSDSRDNL